MFNVHPDRCQPYATPERVYSVVKLVEKKPLTAEEIIDYITLRSNSNTDKDAVTLMISTAQTLGLIYNANGKYKLAVANNAVKDMSSFRKFAAESAFGTDKTTFFKFTKWYLAQNEEVFVMNSWDERAVRATKDGISIDENTVLAWRFWASFLGMGYLNGSLIIPNMTVRLRDVLESKFADRGGKSISADLFLSELKQYVPEAFGDDIHVLNLGLSAGLLTLVKMNLLELKYQNDTTNRFALYKINESRDEFSDVIVKAGG